ncbi:MAG: hypothetical protein NTU44_02330 [Bacteroidetes bacterium]|nr:hypothetical protein [Bacteroidota bacterium]
MRKQYIPPVFEEINIDKQISLVMMSGNAPGDVPNDPQFREKKDDDKKKDDHFASPFE